MVPTADANVPFLTAGFHYGVGVFEGIRAYETPRGPAVFRLREHLERLHGSCHILGFARPMVAVADLRLDQFSQIRETRVGPAASIDKWKIIVIID